MRNKRNVLVNGFFLLLLLISSGAATKKDTEQEIILARIGNKTITVKEFLERSELTVRPGNFKNKYTTLNNLITEKILAIESSKEQSIKENTQIQNTLTGIKEQLMIDKLFYEVAENKARIDTQQALKYYKNSKREYELEFFVVRDTSIVKIIQHKLDSVPNLAEEMFSEVSEMLGDRSFHKIKYEDPDDDIVHESLFSNLLDTGAVVGPLQLEDGSYIVMKVRKWTDYPLISGEDQRQRWEKVQKNLHESGTRKLWKKFQSNVMKGKRLEFNRESFTALADLSFEYYSKEHLNDSIQYRVSELPTLPPAITLSSPLFTIDNKVWSVGDFRNEVLKHPLVFRTTKLNKENYPEQFKLAVADLIRDYYLKQEAYKRKYEKDKEIKGKVNTWSDSFVASTYFKKMIDKATEKGIVRSDDVNGKITYRDSLIHLLQTKYGQSIWINTKELEKLSLTKVDFFAFRKGVPYPAAVPTFPTFISSKNLDYVKKK